MSTEDARPRSHLWKRPTPQGEWRDDVKARHEIRKEYRIQSSHTPIEDYVRMLNQCIRVNDDEKARSLLRARTSEVFEFYIFTKDVDDLKALVEMFPDLADHHFRNLLVPGHPFPPRQVQRMLDAGYTPTSELGSGLGLAEDLVLGTAEGSFPSYLNPNVHPYSEEAEKRVKTSVAPKLHDLLSVFIEGGRTLPQMHSEWARLLTLALQKTRASITFYQKRDLLERLDDHAQDEDIAEYVRSMKSQVDAFFHKDPDDGADWDDEAQWEDESQRRDDEEEEEEEEEDEI